MLFKNKNKLQELRNCIDILHAKVLKNEKYFSKELELTNKRVLDLIDDKSNLLFLLIKLADKFNYNLEENMEETKTHTGEFFWQQKKFK